MIITDLFKFIVFCWVVTAIWSGIEKGLAEQALNNVRQKGDLWLEEVGKDALVVIKKFISDIKALCVSRVLRNKSSLAGNCMIYWCGKV